MRLTQQQVQAIRTTATETFGQDARVVLFGSRADDNKKGGDIDLLICPNPQYSDQLFNKKMRFLAQLQMRLGERKIDVVIGQAVDTRSIVEVAHATGVEIK
jgi:predicted nucleotidyltransferase